MNAIIHCGGFGTRLKSITQNIPKPMIIINGKPLLYWILMDFKKNNITNICITLYYLPEKIINYFKNGNHLGLNITYFIEDKPMGTGGSLIKLANFINNEDFIVAYGDVLIDINFQNLIKFHKQTNALVTAVIHESTHPEDSDLVIFNKINKLIQILDKPHRSIPSNPHNLAALYIMNNKILDCLSSKNKYDIAKDLLPKLLKMNKNIFCYNTKELIMDLGTPERYKIAQKVFKK